MSVLCRGFTPDGWFLETSQRAGLRLLVSRGSTRDRTPGRPLLLTLLPGRRLSEPQESSPSPTAPREAEGGAPNGSYTQIVSGWTWAGRAGPRERG